MLINFRKEILPFLPKTVMNPEIDTPDDCSDVLVASDSMAIVAHNEDANVALVGHTYAFLHSFPYPKQKGNYVSKSRRSKTCIQLLYTTPFYIQYAK